jgi:hypothetical protein
MWRICLFSWLCCSCFAGSASYPFSLNVQSSSPSGPPGETLYASVIVTDVSGGTNLTNYGIELADGYNAFFLVEQPLPSVNLSAGSQIEITFVLGGPTTPGVYSFDFIVYELTTHTQRSAKSNVRTYTVNPFSASLADVVAQLSSLNTVEQTIAQHQADSVLAIQSAASAIQSASNEFAVVSERLESIEALHIKANFLLQSIAFGVGVAWGGASFVLFLASQREKEFL